MTIRFTRRELGVSAGAAFLLTACGGPKSATSGSHAGAGSGASPTSAGALEPVVLRGQSIPASAQISVADAQRYGSNYLGYSNHLVDRAMTVGSLTSNSTTMEKLNNDADVLLWYDMASLPLYQTPMYVAWASKVHGIEPNPYAQGLTWNAQQWATS